MYGYGQETYYMDHEHDSNTQKLEKLHAVSIMKLVNIVAPTM